MFNCIANFNFFFYIRITGYLSEIFNFIDYCQSKSVGGGSNCFKQEILWRVSLWHDWPALPSSFCRASSLRSFTPNYKHDQAGIVNSIIDPFCFFCFGFFNFLPSWFVKSSFFFYPVWAVPAIVSELSPNSLAICIPLFSYSLNFLNQCKMVLLEGHCTTVVS